MRIHMHTLTHTHTDTHTHTHTCTHTHTHTLYYYYSDNLCCLYIVLVVSLEVNMANTVLFFIVSKLHHSQWVILGWGCLSIIKQNQLKLLTWWFSEVYLHDCDQWCIEVVSLRLLCVENLHRICPPRNGENGLKTHTPYRCRWCNSTPQFKQQSLITLNLTVMDRSTTL